jgi:hypothetical protein
MRWCCSHPSTAVVDCLHRSHFFGDSLYDAQIYLFFLTVYAYGIYLYLMTTADGSAKKCEQPLALWILILALSGVFIVVPLFALIGLSWSTSFGLWVVYFLFIAVTHLFALVINRHWRIGCDHAIDQRRRVFIGGACIASHLLGCGVCVSISMDVGWFFVGLPRHQSIEARVSGTSLRLRVCCGCGSLVLVCSADCSIAGCNVGRRWLCDGANARRRPRFGCSREDAVASISATFDDAPTYAIDFLVCFFCIFFFPSAAGSKHVMAKRLFEAIGQ